MKQNDLLQERAVTFLSDETEIKGNLAISGICRLHGKISGELLGEPGSTLIIGESAIVEATIRGDTVLIEGMVTGKIEAKTRVKIGQLGRVIGDIVSPLLEIETGAFFDGSAKTPQAQA